MPLAFTANSHILLSAQMSELTVSPRFPGVPSAPGGPWKKDLWQMYYSLFRPNSTSHQQNETSALMNPTWFPLGPSRPTAP